MNVLLVIPRYNLGNKASYNYTFPIGLGYISSVLKKGGHSVTCLNLNHYDGTVSDLVAQELDRKKYDVVCSGHLALGYVVIEKIIEAVHNHKSKPYFILGGSIVTSEPEIIIKSLKPDFGIIGEGENTIIELLASLENKGNYENVNGIGYLNKDGSLKLTQPRKPIDDLDSIPYPDFDALEYSTWLDNIHSNDIYNALVDHPRIYPVLASRGCPYQCTFCYHSLGLKYRTREIDSVVEELRSNIKKYRINMVNLFDDLFSINRERMLDFCKKMKALIGELSWDCKWGCQLAVNSVDKEMLDVLKKSGCCWISYGFESMSQKVLASMGKPIKPEQIITAYNLTREANMNIQANFIFGDVAETKETAKETIDAWLKYFKGQVSLGLIQPYPGSELYGHCIRRGIIKDKLNFIRNEMGVEKSYNMTNRMSDEEFNELRNTLLGLYVQHSKYVLPRIRKIDASIYEFTLRCPYCKTKEIYTNLYIPNRWYIAEQLVCRNCYKRFYAVNITKKIANMFYVQLKPLMHFYEKQKDRVLKKKLS